MIRIDVAGTSLSVRDQGHGRPVVLLHGFPLDGRMWNAQIEALAATHRVITPDLRGHGQSGLGANGNDAITIEDAVTTMAQMADDLAAVLDVLVLNEPICLCGLSMGGYVAWEFWRRHGGRLGSLVLADTRAAADTPEVIEVRHATAARLLAEGTGFLAEAMLPKLLAPRAFGDNPILVAELTTMIAENEPPGLAAALRGMAARADASGWLAEIDVPTLVIVGEHDQISTVEEMRTIAGALPDARFVEVTEAGHMAPMENADVVNDALAQFLAEQKS
jgi:pimeloyl-ACP methyl ester carboxylesterase